MCFGEKAVVIIRGAKYDVTDFKYKHPGGEHMFALGEGRDATIMFESAHVRIKKAEALLQTLPQLPADYPLPTNFDAPNEHEGEFPTPDKSELYRVIRERVAKEVLKGDCGRGVPVWHYMTVLLTALISAILYVAYPSVTTGVFLGMALAWIGTGVQHSANHGSLSKYPRINYLLGLTDDFLPGGSSLCWRYHHQVSHHAFTNHLNLDQDVFAQFPLLRLDDAQELQWFHRYQWLYGGLAMPALWAGIQWADLEMLFNHKAFLVTFWGTPRYEIFIGLALKVVHVLWAIVLPVYLHGWRTMVVPTLTMLGFGSAFLSLTFIVSHNIEETKNHFISEEAKKDWARWQIETSASWGGVISCFMTGGLCLQIEHHLFPCVRHDAYPAIQKVVIEECEKRGVRYANYTNLHTIIWEMFTFLYTMGNPTDSKRIPESIVATPQDVLSKEKLRRRKTRVAN